jgi:hypothetical protein
MNYKSSLFYFFLITSISIQAQLPMSKKELKTIEENKEVEKKKEFERNRLVSSEASIYVDSQIIDYGTIEYGGNGFKSILVYNRGNKPLIIYRCDAACGCTTPTCPTESIAAGESAEIEIEYKNVTVPGSFNKMLTITSNDPHRPKLIMTIKGKVEDLK